MRGLGSGHVTCGPMRDLEKNCMGRGQTDTHTDKQTDGHWDSMTESAQWADSVKNTLCKNVSIQLNLNWPLFAINVQFSRGEERQSRSLEQELSYRLHSSP